MNGQTVTVSNIEFKVGGQHVIAGKTHVVYNTMPELSLVAFVQLTKSDPSPCMGGVGSVLRVTCHHCHREQSRECGKEK